MEVQDLIEDFKKLAFFCEQTDYLGMKSVRAHNKAVGKMTKIVDQIFLVPNGLALFSGLLDELDNGAVLWVATYILDKTNPNADIKEKALAKIQDAANSDMLGAIGYRYWLKEYQNRTED